MALHCWRCHLTICGHLGHAHSSGGAVLAMDFEPFCPCKWTLSFEEGEQSRNWGILWHEDWVFCKHMGGSCDCV